MSIAAFVNRSKRLSAAQAGFIVAALQDQRNDLATAWGDPQATADVGGPAEIMTPMLFRDENRLPEGCYPMVFVDTPDLAGALGYHSVDEGGKYYARIFVELLLARGTWNTQVSGCASHEYLETCLNATGMIGIVGPRRAEGSRYQREASDPVQGDLYVKRTQFSGRFENVGVSNFVLPDYFRASVKDGDRVDFMGTCPGPFKLAPGGYCLVGDGVSIPSPVYASKAPPVDVLAYKEHGYRWKGGHWKTAERPRFLPRSGR